MISSTETIVVGILADFADALGAGDPGCFELQEVVAVRDRLRAVAARKLRERTYNARARLLLAGLCDVALARDLDAARSYSHSLVESPRARDHVVKVVASCELRVRHPYEVLEHSVGLRWSDVWQPIEDAHGLQDVFAPWLGLHFIR